ncbi:MAG: hypothetical protein WC681_14410 [Sterolibacterium sp.]
MINRPLPKSMHAPLLIAGLAALLFGSVALSGAAILDSFRGYFAPVEEIVAPVQLSETAALTGGGQTSAKPRCEECGVIDSTRRIAATGASAVSYETTLRMSDGSTRVLNDSKPASLNRGEHIFLIGGENPSDR